MIGSRLFGPAGTPDQESAGNLLAPSQVTALGISPPDSKSSDTSSMAITPCSAMVASGATRMAYDEKLASRIRTLLGRSGEFDERKMFGGIAFMVDGHMCCGLVDKTLMLRVGAEAYKEALRRPHTRMMDFTGRAR